MCRPRAGRTIDLPEVFGFLNAVDLTVQAVNEDRHFLAHCHGSGGLTVGVCQHRRVGTVARNGTQ